MQVSNPRKNHGVQSVLFEEYEPENKQLTVAACRNYMGEFFEEASATLLNGIRLVTDATKDVCPDLQIGDREFVESKSIGKTNSVIVYQSRLKKDLDFIELGNKLYYVLWNHGAKVQDGITLGELRNLAATLVKSVALIPAHELHVILEAGPLMVLNPKNTNRGYGSLGYQNGYRSLLKNVTTGLNDLHHDIRINVYGRDVIVPVIRCADSCKPRFETILCK